MSDLCRLIWCGLIGLFRSRAALEAKILVPRHQLNVLRRKSPKRVALSSIDRLLLVGLYRLAPGVVCTENSGRIDYVTESPNVSGDDRSVLPLTGFVRLAVQVEEPT
jgi:hypothetical protein